MSNPFAIASDDSILAMEDVVSNGPFPIRFPSRSLPQDEEWCEVRIEGSWKKIRFHDYDQVYKVPGLYETIFYRTLRCNSPFRVSTFVSEVMSELGLDLHGARALDLGAGNGMSGEALQNIGVRKIVGIDLLNEARDAALRDRPWVYDHYLAADLSDLNKEQADFLQAYKFNMLCTVAALGFGDIPPSAFYHAFNLIQDGGIVVFNIRGEFLKRNSGSPFADFVECLIENEFMEVELLKKYQHRLNTQGQPIYYVGVVARKNAKIPAQFLSTFAN